MAPALFVCVWVYARMCVCASVQAGPCVCLTGVGVPQCVLGFKYPPSIEAVRRDKGWGNRKINGRMEPCRYRAVPINSHWGKGGFQNIPRSLTPPFSTEITPLLLLLLTHLSPFVSFSIFLYPEVACRFLFMKLCRMFFFSSPPWKPIWKCKILYIFLCCLKIHEALKYVQM